MKRKNIKVQYSSRYNTGLLPKIQMEGRWLEELGFSVGTRLAVEYEEGCIRIRPFTPAELAEEQAKELQSELKKKLKEIKFLQKAAAQPLPMVAEAITSYADR